MIKKLITVGILASLIACTQAGNSGGVAAPAIIPDQSKTQVTDLQGSWKRVETIKRSTDGDDRSEINESGLTKSRQGQPAIGTIEFGNGKYRKLEYGPDDMLTEVWDFEVSGDKGYVLIPDTSGRLIRSNTIEVNSVGQVVIESADTAFTETYVKIDLQESSKLKKSQNGYRTCVNVNYGVKVGDLTCAEGKELFVSKNCESEGEILTCK